jgi:hypothetical protein
VVDEDAPADVRPGMDLDSREETREVGDEPGYRRHPTLP